MPHLGIANLVRKILVRKIQLPSPPLAVCGLMSPRILTAFHPHRQLLLALHQIWYRVCRIGHGKRTDTNYHRNVQKHAVQNIAGSSPPLRHRPPDPHASGGARVAESDRLLSGEAGGLGPGSGVGGLGVDHSSAFTAGGLGSPQHQAAAAPSPPRPWLSPDGREVHHPGVLWACRTPAISMQRWTSYSRYRRADPPHAGGLRCPGRGDGVGAPGGMSGERGFWGGTNPIFIAVLRGADASPMRVSRRVHAASIGDALRDGERGGWQGRCRRERLGWILPWEPVLKLN